MWPSPRLLAAGSSLAVAGLMGIVDRGVGAVLAFGATVLCLAALRRSELWPKRARLATYLALAALALVFAWPVVGTASANVRDPGEWDFLGFWLHSQTALARENFYDPVHAQRHALGLTVSDAFRTEIIDVGFWYPPQSMLLFWPLGLLPRPLSLVLWYCVNALVLAGAVVVMRRTLCPGRSALAVLVTAVLVLACHGTQSTVMFAQTTFVCLLFVALSGIEPGRVGAGAAVAAAFFVKPFAGLLALPAFFARDRRTLAGGISFVVASSLVALVGFGAEVFFQYFRLDQTANKPSWIYAEPTNQSLLGLTLRLSDAPCEGTACVTYPPFVVLFALGLAVTVGLTTRLTRETDLTKALWLTFALLFYPVSQVFYSVLLVWVALVSWRRGEPGKVGWFAHATVIAVMFGLARAQDGRFTVLAYGLAWLLVLAQGARVAFPALARRVEVA